MKSTRTIVYGYSDDIVEVECPDEGRSWEIDCYDCEVEIDFADGTTVRIGYPKPDMAVWWIEVKKLGSAALRLTPCEDEDAETYSDIFEIESYVLRHRVIRKRG